MTNDEPTYEYVKGHGWVPTYTESASITSNGYRITLLKRLPNLGERGFSRLHPHGDLSEELKHYTRYNGAELGWPCNQTNYDYTRGRTDNWHYWVTVGVERVA
jgi:hypothetical protein